MSHDNVYRQRGVKDLIQEDALLYQTSAEKFLYITKLYNFKIIETPIFEKEILFKRPLGEDSDIVTKEMYSFEDKGGDRITLRPEGTAPTVRSVIEHKLYETLPLKLCYFGPMFRYERPQKGRYRQFHQFGTEVFSEKSPETDAESILMACDFIKSLGIDTSSTTLHINSLGSDEDRMKYREVLRQFFSLHFDELSEISKMRFHKNPLRILDSKEQEDIKLIADVPSILDTLSKDSREYFEKVISILDQNAIKYKLDKYLVRGLDYYTDTIFEFKSDSLGAQSTFLAGGRYDNLVELLGGPKLSGFGWAAGYERLALISRLAPHKNTLIAVLSDDTNSAFKVAQYLRNNGISTEILIRNSFKHLLKKAFKSNPDYAIFIGEDERMKGTIQLKNLAIKTQKEIILDEVLNNLD